jgi:hypothetical protein
MKAQQTSSLYSNDDDDDDDDNDGDGDGDDDDDNSIEARQQKIRT